MTGPLPYRHQSTDLQSKSMDWFLYDNGLRHERVKMRESQKVMLLGLTIDNCLTFKDHNNTLCRNASNKLHALGRIRKDLTPDKAKVLYNAFINSQFSYASII